MIKLLNKQYGGKKAFIFHLFYKAKHFIIGLPCVDPIPDKIQHRRVVFACKGNICRSALAHQYLLDLCQWDVVSFGLDSHSGKPANERVTRIALEIGVNLKSHKTTALKDYTFKQGDIIICMEPWQCESVKKLYPKALVNLLGLFLECKRPYLHDPYASAETWVYTSVILIKQAVKNLYEKHIK